MQIDLSGKTAIVTGSTDGIGFAIARQFALSGAQVVVNGRRQEKVDAAIGRLAELVSASQLRGVAADVATIEGCEAIIAAVPSCDVLVNNAGIFEPVDFFEAGDDLWDRHWQVNVMSGVRLSRAYLPGMEKKGWGRVIFLGSESAFNIPVDMIHYGVSKTADVAVARGLAKRMAGSGVTVNSVLPGPTLSAGVAEMLKGEQAKSGKPIEEVAADFVRQNRSSNILRRAATVEEVANLVAYVASPLSSATTGASLRVDGGTIDTL